MRNTRFLLATFLFFVLTILLPAQTDPANPNILLIVADDLGVDAFNGYQNNNQKPETPHLDSLRQSGVTFRNAWAAPQCTPTRGYILTGKYGHKTGVTSAPGHIDPTSHSSIFKAIKDHSGNLYSNAVLGKWHVSNPIDNAHPAQLEVDYFEGVINGFVSNTYEDWEKTLGGLNHTPSVENESEYATTFFTSKAIDWIQQQNQPWLLSMMQLAPHDPYHVPPDPSTYSQSPVSTNLQKYMAMIEALDFEIGRLLDNIDAAVLANTTIIFLGDNGGGNGVSQQFPFGRNKGTLYQGGLHVPFFACGAKVSRQNVWDESLINVVDVYATILELTGQDLDGGIYNSFSFLPKLQSSTSPGRTYNFVAIQDSDLSTAGHTIRNDQYKYLAFKNGTEELYNIKTDTMELANLINDPLLVDVIYDLKREANKILQDWSCLDMIKNGDEIDVDCGTPACGQCASFQTTYDCNEYMLEICDDIHIDTFVIAESEIIDSFTITSQQAYFQAKDCVLLQPGFSFEGQEFEIVMDDCEVAGIDDTNCVSNNALNTSNIGCNLVPTEPSIYSEVIIGNLREITTNNYPNHNHDAKNPANIPVPKDYTFQVEKEPVLNTVVTSVLSQTNRPRYFFGVAVNGVILAPAPAAPFIFTNVSTGEYNYDWIFEPTNNSGLGQGWVALDCAAAHIGPQGYHYHGNMIEYLETYYPGSSTLSTPPNNVIHIGWAADGYPILYRFGPDGVGGVDLLQPSFRLKYGNRPGDGLEAPCGSYNGKYTVDYEYVSCLGDLDECNGINRQVTIPTIEGDKTFDYFYVVTDSFPQISRCFKGSPDQSFR